MPAAGKNVLFVVDRPCFPVTDGSSQRYWTWIRYLTDRGYVVHFLSFDGPNGRWDAKSRSILKDLVADFLIVDAASGQWLRPADSGLRYLSRLATGRYFANETLDGVFSGRRNRLVAEYVGRCRAETIVVNKVEGACLMGLDNIRRFGGKKIIDIHDIHAEHYLLAKRVLAGMGRDPALRAVASGFLAMRLFLMPFRHQKAFEEEAEIYSLFDVVLPTSLSEYRTLAGSEVLSGRVRYLSPLVVPGRGGDPDRPPAGPVGHDVGFIAGSGLFNVEAVGFLGRLILPRLWERKPRLRVAIAGAVCGAARRMIGEREELSYLPRVENLEEFYGTTKVVVVPVLSGTGISIKALEAMSHGRPVVSTGAGVRGLEIEPGRDALVEDDPDGFARAVVRLLDDDGERRRLAARALDVIRERYSPERHHDILHSVLDP